MPRSGAKRQGLSVFGDNAMASSQGVGTRVLAALSRHKYGNEDVKSKRAFVLGPGKSKRKGQQRMTGGEMEEHKTSAHGQEPSQGG